MPVREAARLARGPVPAVRHVRGIERDPLLIGVLAVVETIGKVEDERGFRADRLVAVVDARRHEKRGEVVFAEEKLVQLAARSRAGTRVVEWELRHAREYD